VFDEMVSMAILNPRGLATITKTVGSSPITVPAAP
jgi:hypothetical protein